MKTRLPWIMAAVLAVLGCRDEGRAVTAGRGDGGPRRRVPEPNLAPVRALPPHEIHELGVGPYLLGESLRSTIDRLPHGPFIELLQVEGVADYSLVRAEGGSIVIAVQKPAGVTSISVLAKDIARTDKEVGVGSPVRDVIERHGRLVLPRNRAADPRIVRAAMLPGARFIRAEDKVEAVVVERPPEAAAAAPPCVLDDLEQRAAAIAIAARLGKGATVAGSGCLSGAEPEVLVVEGDRIAVVAPGSPPRRLAVLSVPGLIFAAPIEVDGDERDEVLTVSQVSAAGIFAVTVGIARLDGGRLTPVASSIVYRLEDGAATWVGERPDRFEFLIEAEGRGGLLVVGGLYVQREGDRPQEIVALTPTSLVVRPRTLSPTPVAADAGPIEASDGGSRPAPRRRPSPALHDAGR